MMCRVAWSPLLELYELTAEVKDEHGKTLLKGLSAKVGIFTQILCSGSSVCCQVVNQAVEHYSVSKQSKK